MGACQEKQLRKFCGFQAILNKQDRRTKVSVQQSTNFPFNTIGWVESKQKQSQKDRPRPNIFATGFLISNDLVLTSCHNFLDGNQKTGEVIQLLPLSFNLQQPKPNRQEGINIVSKDIIMAKTNTKFIQIQAKILFLKNKLKKQKNQQMKLSYIQSIFNLESEAIQHDFALLKLQQPIERTQYFQLFPYLKDKPKVAVTGYVNFLADQFNLLTHDNTIQQIKARGIFYDIDTARQQGGSPVYTTKGIPKVVGIHKGCWPDKKLNYATLITQEIIQTIQIWTKEIQISLKNINKKIIDQQLSTQISNKSKQYLPVFPQKQNDNIAKSKQNTPVQSLSSNFFAQPKSKQQENQINHAEIFAIEYAKQLSDKAVKCQEQNKINQSIESYKKSLQIYQKLKGKDTIECAEIMSRIGWIYFKQNQFTEAQNYDQSALRIYQIVKGNESLDYAKALNNIGLVYRHQGRLNESLQYLSRSLTIKQKILGKDSNGYQKTFKNIGLVYKALTQSKKQLEQKDRMQKKSRET